MGTLIEEIDFSLKKFNLPPISDVVNNKEKSISYINKILRQYGNKVTIPFQLSLERYDFRVKHVVFSFGLGIVLASFCDLKNRIENQYRKYKIDNAFIYTWLTLCLYHDFGYFIGSSYLRTDNIQDLQLDHYIFEYDYCRSRYSKNLYVEYYKKKYEDQSWEDKNYDMSNNEEVGDHGILGGYILFSRLYESEIKQDSSKLSKIAKALYELEEKNNKQEYHLERIPLYQDICYRIMEHNIWKNEKCFNQGHPFFEIDSNNFKLIDLIEPLLYLLSLVDTIEMTKRFCTYTDNSNNKEKYIYPKTLAKKINVNVSRSTITMEYSELEKFIKDNKYFGDISRWENGIAGLADWVSLDISVNDSCCTITKVE